MKNAGDFYIIEELCLTCRVPESIAPDIIGFHEGIDPATSHCYMKKQPATCDELARTVAAFRSCCCGAYRYKGEDQETRRKLGTEICDS